MEEALEAFHVALHHVLIAGHGFRFSEEDPEHAANVVYHQRNTRFFRRLQQAVGKLGGQVGEGVMNTRLRDLGQTGKARRHGNRVTGERSRLVHRAGWRERFHHLFAPAKRTYRHTAADDFAKAGQIRDDVVVRLRARQRHAEAGHHFIDNQQRAKFVAQGAQARQELGLRRNTVHVARDRFNDNAGDLLWILLERFANGVEIVIGAGQGVLSEVRRYARRVWLAEGQRAGAGFHQQAVRVAVVAAFKFDDLVAAGKPARQTDRAHGRFGARVHHAHHVHRRHQFGHQRRHFDFHLGWRAEAQTALGRFNHRVADSRVVMPQHHRTPGTDIIDIGFAIDIKQVRAVSAFNKQRRSTYAGKGANRRVHAAWNKLAGCTVEVF